MRIFISYPREFEKSAEVIYWELQSRGFLDVFLDSEAIHAGDTWKVGIEKQIREASVFIILYDHEAAEDKSRYFCAELKRINEECKNIEKLIITVLFPPTTKDQLQTPLKFRQYIASTTKEIDPPSIDMVIGEVRRREAERQEAERQEAERLRNIENARRKKIRLYSLLIIAILIMVGLVELWPGSSGLETCERLKGTYRLRGSYVYLDVPGIRATSYEGSWTAHNCKKIVGQEGAYELEGREWTKQKIEFNIGNGYEPVAYARNESNSALIINKAGGLADRRISFTELDKPSIELYDLSKKESWKLHSARIREMVKEYEKHVEKKHRSAQESMHCIPALAKNNQNQDIIASICPSDPPYVRVMEKSLAIIQSR